MVTLPPLEQAATVVPVAPLHMYQFEQLFCTLYTYGHTSSSCADLDFTFSLLPASLALTSDFLACIELRLL